MHSGCMHIAPGTVLTSKLKALTEAETETTQVGEGGGKDRHMSSQYESLQWFMRLQVTSASLIIIRDVLWPQ